MKCTAKKTLQIGVRVDAATHKQLEKEATAAKRKLADYVRILVETHPARGKAQ